MCRLKSVVVEREGQLGQGGREEEEGEERDEPSGKCDHQCLVSRFKRGTVWYDPSPMCMTTML